MPFLTRIRSIRGNGVLLLSGISSLGVATMLFVGWPGGGLFYGRIIWIDIGLIITGPSRAVFSDTLRRMVLSQSPTSTPVRY
jgi:hypothetical protein